MHIFPIYILYDCAAFPTFMRFRILSFCLKPLHSYRALHFCSHDNLSSLLLLLLFLPPHPSLLLHEQTAVTWCGVPPQFDSKICRFICHWPLKSEDRISWSWRLAEFESWRVLLSETLLWDASADRIDKQSSLYNDGFTINNEDEVERGEGDAGGQNTNIKRK